MKADYTMYRREIIRELDGQLEKLDGFFSYTTGKEGERIVTPILKTGRNLMQDFGGWHGVGDMLNGLTFGNFVIAWICCSKANRRQQKKTIRL